VRRLFRATALCSITSPYLVDSDNSDFLIDQLLDIGDVCNVTIPEITVRALPSDVNAPPVTSTNFGSTTISTAPASTTCAGQLLKSSSKRSPKVRGRVAKIDESITSCDTLSKKYGISTGDLQALSQSSTCTFTGNVCFPASCTLLQVPVGATW
jgi:hypothetical protein